MRVLEHLARHTDRSAGASGLITGDTRLFIRPGFEFRMVDALVTNFHLPRTSLLALVMAFCGVEETRDIYRHAVRERYRFYSFGDAMLAL
jgi:S-adenosylmethionine:tRNA ribosyltransferase-isomerase